MADKILFVDDEAAVLEGYKRILYPEFDVETALGAEQAFVAMKENGPYSVVVSDMRMPVMNGAEFLSKVRQSKADTVRMLLTGYTDLGAAIEAINQGNVFRFLTKPCEPDVLGEALTAGIEQYRLVTGERELLEKTLLGSIHVLNDVLSAASPEAFGRSMRIVHYVRHIMSKLTLPSHWCIEAAAALSQLGCITLESGLVLRAYAGTKLEPEEQALFDAHPRAAMEILKNIPRLESVSWVIGQQLKGDIPKPEVDYPGFTAAELMLGAKVLKLAVAFEQLREKFPAKGAANARLRERSKEFEANLIDAMNDLQPLGGEKQLLKVSTSRLRAGMVLDQEIKNGQGVLLVAKGQELSSALILRLENHIKGGTIAKEVMAFVPMAANSGSVQSRAK
jgi:ActR/RegA family two-component response regulator